MLPSDFDPLDEQDHEVINRAEESLKKQGEEAKKLSYAYNKEILPDLCRLYHKMQQRSVEFQLNLELFSAYDKERKKVGSLIRKSKTKYVEIGDLLHATGTANWGFLPYPECMDL